MTVKVTDDDEAGKVTLSTQDARTGAPITAALDRPGRRRHRRQSGRGTGWTMAGVVPVADDPDTAGVDEGTDIPMATSATYTPIFDDDPTKTDEGKLPEGGGEATSTGPTTKITTLPTTTTTPGLKDS